MAGSLWQADVDAWRRTWQMYTDAVELLGNSHPKRSKLVELDSWARNSLPSLLHDRDPEPYLRQPELVQLMEWKLTKGKWRPQLLGYVKALEEDAVKDQSKAALETIRSDASSVKQATEQLCVLKGVGPATASAVLAAYDDNVPFMSDEALEAVAHIIGPRKYTLSHFLKFVDTMQSKADELNKESDDEWTPQGIQLCLFAADHLEESNGPTKRKVESKPTATSKRSRRK